MYCVGRPVGAHERQLLQLLDARDVDDDTVLASLEPALAQPRLHQLPRLREEVRLEEHTIEGDAQVGERLALAGDHPCACLEPQRQRLALAAENALEQLVGRVVLDLYLARVRILGTLEILGREQAARRHIVGVANSDEVIALLGSVRRSVSAARHHSRHGLAHAAPGVGDQAAPLDLRAGLLERGRDRVAEREVAQMSYVQGLGRVGIPELHREALTVRQIGQGRFGAATGLERRSGRLDPAVVESQLHAALDTCERGRPWLSFGSLQGLQRLGIVAPVGRAWHQLDVEVRVRAPWRASGPRGMSPILTRCSLEIVKKVDCHEPPKGLSEDSETRTSWGREVGNTKCDSRVAFHYEQRPPGSEKQLRDFACHGPLGVIGKHAAPPG